MATESARRTDLGSARTPHRARLSAFKGILAIEGELDVADAPTVQADLENAFGAGLRAVLVDLSGCSFIDCGGLGALVRAAHPARGGGDRPIALVGGRGQVQRLLEIAGLDQFLPRFATIDEAVWGRSGSSVAQP